MRAHYFVNTRREEVLFVPYSFVAKRNKGDLEISFDPDIISKPNQYRQRNTISMQRGLIAIVDIPDEELRPITEYNLYSEPDKAKLAATGVFWMVKRNWRKMKVKR